MKIGLAVYESRNRDIEYNLAQIERALQAARGSVDLLCFGEAFLQGFDSLSWDAEQDLKLAVSRDSEPMRRLCGLTLRGETDLLFGYLEREGETIYSSCAVLEKGKLIRNYRRISPGWKEPEADEHYREGTDTSEFLYGDQVFQIALCGDLWFAPERFRTDGTLLWPVYLNYSPEEWAECETEYAAQAQLAARRTLAVNPISEEPRSFGGAFDFREGGIADRLPLGQEGILVAEV